MRTLVLACLVLLVGRLPAHADVLFSAVPGDLRYAAERVLAKDMVVYDTTEYDGGLKNVCYYYWDSSGRHVVTKCHSAKSGEVIRLERSAPSDRTNLVESIKQRGVRAEITNSKGAVAEHFCLLADYEAPTGYTLLSLGNREDDVQYRDAESKIMLLEPGKPNPTWFDFSQVKMVRFEGDLATVSTQDGRSTTGQWAGSEVSPGKPRLRVVLRGIKSDGVPTSIKLDQVFSIAFR